MLLIQLAKRQPNDGWRPEHTTHPFCSIVTSGDETDIRPRRSNASNPRSSLYRNTTEISRSRTRWEVDEVATGSASKCPKLAKVFDQTVPSSAAVVAAMLNESFKGQFLGRYGNP